ncbi:hypothetical protein EV426DRAFT_608995 [Tirmania nivea]|nr:hypothetical protein EV426DRAFT_608995 [Tirmania nivea]
MSDYNMHNPTKGQKVKSVKGEDKHEYAGPIASDSLAAESLRSGGHFAEGNPAGISGVSGSSSTFAAHPNASGPHYQEIPSGHKKGDQDVFETGRKGGIDNDLKTKAGRVGTVGGGQQTEEGFAGVDAQGRSTKHPITVQYPVRKRGDVEQHRKKSDEEHLQLGFRGCMSAGECEEEEEQSKTSESKRSKKYRGPSHNRSAGVVGQPELAETDQVDWEKIPKDFEPPPVGTEDDPGRVAELNFAKLATRHSHGTDRASVPPESRGFGKDQDDVIKEGNITSKSIIAGKLNPYGDLNPDEHI